MDCIQLIFTLLASLICTGPMTDDNHPAAKPEKKIQKDEKLRKELLHRFQEDQEARKSIIALMGKLKTSDPTEIKKMDLPEVKKLNEVDRRNTDRMKEIVEQYGWPGKTLVDTDGANAAWLLVQHADHDVTFQKRCLALMEPAVKKGDVSAGDWAYLTDRVRIAEKKKQLYGTQLQEIDGQWKPLPIEDEPHVDQRRKEVGLSSLTDYLKFVETTFKPKAEPKDKKPFSED